MIKILRKIFDPKYTDRKVEEINAETRKMLEDTDKIAKRHNALLRRNGVMMQIYIATGGDRRGIH